MKTATSLVKSIILLIAASAALMPSCTKTPATDPLFSPLSYIADGPQYTAGQEYANPIIPGFYPDPSICRVGEDYYLVQSSFQYFPAIPVWHSTDLVNWEPCGHVLDSDDKITFRSRLMQFGIFAPQISYNPANKLFYVITSQIEGDLGSFFCTSEDPLSGKWSDPVKLPELSGIDPSLFFDEDGSAYVCYACSPADIGEKQAYWDENSIVMRRFDWKEGKTFGKPMIIARGGAHPENKPVALEGPHIYKVDGKYCLMCAEGGTELGHSEVAFISENIEGPYTPCKINPILTQRGLPEDRAQAVSCTGHADLVQTQYGDWYAVFLGCRSYERDVTYNTGRETFLLPVKWVEGGPIILDEGEAIAPVHAFDEGLKKLSKENKIKGFSGYNPGPLWDKNGLKEFAVSVRGSLNGRVKFLKDTRMQLECSGISLDSLSRPSAVFERITSTDFTAETTMEFDPSSPDKEAGLLCWHDDDHYMKLVKTLDADGKPILLLMMKGTSPRKELRTLLFGRMDGKTLYTFSAPLEGKAAKSPLLLRVKSTDGAKIQFSYAVARSGGSPEFKDVGDVLDGRQLSTLYCGGFQGAMVGVYAY